MASKKNTAPPSADDKLLEWAAERNLTIGVRSAVYISTPITTGPLFVDWMQHKGKYLKKDSSEYETSLKAEVILPNIQRATSVIEMIRWNHTGLIINPTGLDIPGWNQQDYHHFWTAVLSRYAQRAIFLLGWEYSHGCTLEFEIAQRYGIDCIDEQLQPISLIKGINLISEAIERVKTIEGDTKTLKKIVEKLQTHKTSSVLKERKLFKDEVLDHLACTSNVAQFVSFGPGYQLRQRFCRIIGHEPNHKFNSPEEAITALLQRAPSKKVNIRSYQPESPEGNPFIKHLDSTEKVVSEIKSLAQNRHLHTIVNEVIDESDGGVSGVCYRGLLEFAPDSTPRCVDDDNTDTAILPFKTGMNILQIVYGFEPDLRGRDGARIEFSIHPKCQGWNQRHTIIWQSEQRPGKKLKIPAKWPHQFSRLLGDKVFGLVTASAAGFPVPRTTVFNRRLFPFTFGQSLGLDRQFITRTSPEIKEPGYYPTEWGWHDPYAILEGRILTPPKRDWGPPPAPLSSVLIQQIIPAVYSGRAFSMNSDRIEVKGVPGEGDSFMLGGRSHENLPKNVVRLVKELVENLKQLAGHNSIEWVYDGNAVWIVQLNNTSSVFQQNNPGTVVEWVRFNYSKNRIEEFRKKVMELRGSGKGIKVIGKVSPLSHLGEIAEIYDVPVTFSHP